MVKTHNFSIDFFVLLRIGSEFSIFNFGLWISILFSERTTFTVSGFDTFPMITEASKFLSSCLPKFFLLPANSKSFSAKTQLFNLKFPFGDIYRINAPHFSISTYYNRDFLFNYHSWSEIGISTSGSVLINIFVDWPYEVLQIKTVKATRKNKIL